MLHQNINNIKEEIKCKTLTIDPDSKFLVYSYLTLEEILIIFEHNILLKTKLLRLYYPVLPDIDDAAKYNNLYTLKYLISSGELPSIKTLNIAIRYNHLSLVKYL